MKSTVPAASRADRPFAQGPNTAARVAAVLLPGAVAALGSLAWHLGAQRTGYDPLRDSLSALGERGTDGAAWFTVAAVGVGLSVGLSGLAIRAADRLLAKTGLLVALAGCLVVAAALVPSAQRPDLATVAHRGLTGAALAALVLAALAGARARTPESDPHRAARVSALAGWAGAAGLALGLGLLIPGFPGGLWERCLFGLAVAWVEWVLVLLGYTGLRRSAASAES